MATMAHAGEPIITSAPPPLPPTPVAPNYIPGFALVMGGVSLIPLIFGWWVAAVTALLITAIATIFGWRRHQAMVAQSDAAAAAVNEMMIDGLISTNRNRRAGLEVTEVLTDVIALAYATTIGVDSFRIRRDDLLRRSTITDAPDGRDTVRFPLGYFDNGCWSPGEHFELSLTPETLQLIRPPKPG